MRAPTRSWWLIGIIVAIIATPLILPGVNGDFKGSDDMATEAINAARPGYQPWFQPLWKPPSDEVESLLFCVQAAIGAGVLGYVIGRRHASRRDDVATR